jgi:hypothetical protein
MKMPYIFASSSYPTHKVNEVVEKYFEALKKYPPDRTLGKELIQAAVSTDEKGIKSLGVSLVKEGKLNEALTYIGKMMAMFQPIEGFEYKIRVWNTVIEALDMIGMKLPGQ